MFRLFLLLTGGAGALLALGANFYFGAARIKEKVPDAFRTVYVLQGRQNPGEEQWKKSKRPYFRFILLRSLPLWLIIAGGVSFLFAGRDWDWKFFALLVIAIYLIGHELMEKSYKDRSWSLNPLAYNMQPYSEAFAGRGEVGVDIMAEAVRIFGDPKKKIGDQKRKAWLSLIAISAALIPAGFLMLWLSGLKLWIMLVVVGVILFTRLMVITNRRIFVTAEPFR